MGESLRAKIWETLDKGLGNLFKPWQIQREELAQAHSDRIRQLISAKTTKEVELLNHDRLDIDDKGRITYLGIKNQKFGTYRELFLDDEKERIIQKKINLLNVISVADSIAESQPDTGNASEPSYEWFERWRENAEYATSDDLRILWAKVICKECEKQGNVSLKTMDYLRNLSHEDANSIEKFSRLNAGPMIIRCFGNPLIEDVQVLPPEYTLGEFKELEENGIITDVGELGFSCSLRDIGTADESFFRITVVTVQINITNDDKTKDLIINGFKITKIGRELFSIINSTADIQYVKNIVGLLNRRGFKTDVRNV